MNLNELPGVWERGIVKWPSVEGPVREQCHGELWDVGGSSEPRAKKDTREYVIEDDRTEAKLLRFWESRSHRLSDRISVTTTEGDIRKEQ